MSKHKTVTLYKITVTKAYMASMELGTRYSLSPWGNDTDQYEGYDDGGTKYILPDGFNVSESSGGSMEFYGPDGDHFVLTKAGTHPMITNGHKDIHLKRV